LWVPGNLLAIIAMNMLGLSVASGLWSGCIITVSFLWGAVFFRDPVKNIWLTLLGLVMLFAGIIGLALCKSSTGEEKTENSDEIIKETDINIVETDAEINAVEETSNPGDLHLTQEPMIHDDHAESYLASEEVTQSELLDDGVPLKPQSVYSTVVSKLSDSKTYLFGILCCVMVGCLGGSVMVPTRYAPDLGIVYTVSFGIGNIIVTPILAVIYFLAKRQMPQFHFKVGLPACCSAGVLWNIGNICGTYAVLSPLGLTVGYPLTQVALVVAGLWGIVVFKELKGWKAILQFSVSTLLLLLPGCALLALFGKA
jgi:glucose uptake protein GlcU